MGQIDTTQQREPRIVRDAPGGDQALARGPFQQQRRNGGFDGESVLQQQQQQQQKPRMVHGSAGGSADGFQQQQRQQQLAAGSTGGVVGQVSCGVFVGGEGGGAAAGSFAASLPVKPPANVASPNAAHPAAHSPLRPTTSRVAPTIARQRDALDLMEAGYSSRRVAEKCVLGSYYVLGLPSTESHQPKQSTRTQQPAASFVPSPTADHVDETRPAAPSSTVGVCGTASAPAAVAAGATPPGVTAAAAATHAAAVVSEEQSEEVARATEAAVLFLEDPVARSRRVDSSGLKHWSLFRCLGRGGGQGVFAGSGGGGGQTCNSSGDDGIYGLKEGASYPFYAGRTIFAGGV